jgi:dehydrogenase/reductase SDR family protein 7B
VDYIQMNDLQNKIVWITGASSGIGKAVANKYNGLGATVILSSRKKNALEQVQRGLPHPEKSFVLPLDLTKSEEFVPATKLVIDKYKDIDILINNGGISQRSLAAETPMNIDRAIMEVNYFGHVGLTKAVLPFMQTQKESYIITISSLSGKFGFFQRSAYAASKHALQGFFESLRLEEEKNNIKVLLVYPGFVDTQMSQNALKSDGTSHGEHDQNQAEGITPEACAEKIVAAMLKDKLEVFPGGKETKAVTLKRLAPNAFHKMIKKQKPT